MCLSLPSKSGCWAAEKTQRNIMSYTAFTAKTPRKTNQADKTITEFSPVPSLTYTSFL